MNGAVPDAGKLVAFERSDRVVLAIVAQAMTTGDPLVVPAGVIVVTTSDSHVLHCLDPALRLTAV